MFQVNVMRTRPIGKEPESACNQTVTPVTKKRFANRSTSAGSKTSTRGITLRRGVTKTIHNATFVQVVFTHLHFHGVTRCDLDEVLSKLSGNIGQDKMPVCQLHSEHRSWEDLFDFTFYLNNVFGHISGLSAACWVGSLKASTQRSKGNAESSYSQAPDVRTHVYVTTASGFHRLCPTATIYRHCTTAPKATLKRSPSHHIVPQHPRIPRCVTTQQRKPWGSTRG